MDIVTYYQIKAFLPFDFGAVNLTLESLFMSIFSLY